MTKASSHSKSVSKFLLLILLGTFCTQSFSLQVASNSKVLSSSESSSDSLQSNTTNTTATPVIQLGSAADFVILAAAEITDQSPSLVVGDVGMGNITGAAFLLECSEVVGNIYTVNASGPVCSISNASLLNSAIEDMVAAYNNAVAVNNTDYSDLGDGLIGGWILGPGVYNWSSSVLIDTDLYIAGNGSHCDRWLFQIDGDLDLAEGITIHISSGAKPNHIVWQVAGEVNLGSSSYFEGIILAQTAINLSNGATVTGKLFSQTTVNLQTSTVVQPQN